MKKSHQFQHNGRGVFKGRIHNSGSISQRPHQIRFLSGRSHPGDGLHLGISNPRVQMWMYWMTISEENPNLVPVVNTTPMSFTNILLLHQEFRLFVVHKVVCKRLISSLLYPGIQLFNMASTHDSKSAHASASSPQRQEKTNDGLQFDEATAFSADPVPKSGAFVSAASDSDEDGNEIKKNPFLDPDVAEHWSMVYEKAEYECRHVFDPSFTWTEEEEKKLVRRLDWRVCLWAVSRIQKAC
jgi:hypothetical protein